MMEDGERERPYNIHRTKWWKRERENIHHTPDKMIKERETSDKMAEEREREHTPYTGQNDKRERERPYTIHRTK
jgi:hypothetical protein